MKKRAVLSGTGPDRVGVADDLSAALASRNIRIDDSRWTALGGRFSVMVQVCGERDAVARLRSDLSMLRENLGFDLQLAPMEPARPTTRAPQYLIECFASGPPGMSAVTGLLKRHGVNIEQLETEAGAAPFSSAITFHMTARITIPPSSSFDNIQNELRRLERERDIDVVIKPSPTRLAERDLAPVAKH